MKNIFRIIKKNLKLLIRAKSSALIIILAPLLIILLIGIAFDNANTYGLNIGVFSSEYNENVESFLTKLSQKEFKITKYQDQERCVNDIKLGTTHTCIIFPPGLDFNSNQQQTITFYVDYSKINLVWMVMDTLSAGIAARSEEITKDLTSILVSKIEKTEKDLSTNKPVLLNIKTENSNVLVKAQEISTNLAALDINFSSFSINETQGFVSNLQDNVTSKIESAKSSISSAKSSIGSSDASENEKENIIEKLDSALINLNSAKLDINDSSNESNTSLTYINTLLQDIQDQLNQTKTQITASVISSQQKITETQSSLSQSITQLTTIETMMANLLTEIQSIKVKDPAAIASPVTTDIKPISAQKTYLNYLFPSLMVLVVMFISILLGTTLVMMEKHSPALFRNFITPTRNIIFIISTYLTNIFLVLVQLVIILGISIYFFSSQILPSLPLVVLILLIAATLFSFIGMGVGYLFRSEETATLAAISFGSLALFLSSTIIPLESMPTTIRQIAFYNPFVIAERTLRSIILFQPKIKFLANDIFLLLGYAFVLFLLIWGGQYFISKHYLQRIKYRRHKKSRLKKLKKNLQSKPVKTEVKKETKEPEVKTKTPSPHKKPTTNKNTDRNSQPIKRPSHHKELESELDRINSELSGLR